MSGADSKAHTPFCPSQPLQWQLSVCKSIPDAAGQTLQAPAWWTAGAIPASAELPHTTAEYDLLDWSPAEPAVTTVRNLYLHRCIANYDVYMEPDMVHLASFSGMSHEQCRNQDILV